MKNFRILLCSALVVLLTAGLFMSAAPAAEDKKLVVLCTTFPIYQITRNLTQGRTNLDVQLMLPSELGCPHDYALTPQDMRKLNNADLLVINGLGMEEFLGAPLKRAAADLKIIDSSLGIENLLHYTEDQRDEQGHQHDGVNPHLFVSPRMAARIAMNIAAGLAQADPAGAATCRQNAQTYAAALNRLADQMAALGKRVQNHRIVQPHGVFDYLARDMGLEIVAITRAEGQEPSAAEMLELVKIIRDRQVGAIFTEPQYPDKVGKTLARETGVPVAVLDPVATGPEHAPLDYYSTTMRKNMQTLEITLGVK